MVQGCRRHISLIGSWVERFRAVVLRVGGPCLRLEVEAVRCVALRMGRVRLVVLSLLDCWRRGQTFPSNGVLFYEPSGRHPKKMRYSGLASATKDNSGDGGNRSSYPPLGGPTG